MNTGVRKPIPAAWQPHIDEYLLVQAAAGRPKTTLGTRRAHLAHVARSLRCKPHEVTAKRLVAWFGRQKHWARETRRGYRNTLRSFFQWGHRVGLFAENFATELPHVKARKPAPRPAPEDVWEAAVEHARRNGDDRVALMLQIAAHGLRRAEVAQVHVRDVTRSASGYVLLVHGKGDKKRTIPLAVSTAERLLEGAAGHTPGASTTGYLFPGADDGHLSPRWTGRLCSRTMPGVWTMHTLRHRAATRAFRVTRNLVAVQKMMGHESVATTQMYTYVDDDEVRAAMMAAVGTAA